MVDDEATEARNRHKEMESERDEEVEEELERVDEEMDPKQDEQSHESTLPDDEEGEHARKDGRHVETEGGEDSA